MTEYFDCYIRVSTQEQTKGFSLDTQEEVGRKLAKEKGLKFRLRNEGGRSSTIHYRPVLEELKDDIEIFAELVIEFARKHCVVVFCYRYVTPAKTRTDFKNFEI